MLAGMSTRPTTVPNREEPSGRRRDDACPGALRLHAADDGALARVRLPGGLLDASAARVLADLAEEFGDGRVDLTSRGNMQLRALPTNCGAVLASRLRAAGLLPSDTHERARNIVATPLAGARSGVHAVAREVDRALCADPAAARLSGRFLFAVDDGRGDAATLDADVTLVAPTPPVEPGAADGAAPAVGPWRLALGPDARVTVRRKDAARAAVTAALLFLATGDRFAEAPGTTAPASPEPAAGGRPDRIWRVTDLPVELLPDTDRLLAALAGAGISADPAP
ncbi:nitrite reductase, partial [Streptomyces alkaliphilus]|nr:nitrite reductase [Streptomyces alkaliphilus]